MLANLDAADQRDLELLARRNQARLDATLTNLPGWTWRRFAEEVQSAGALYPQIDSPDPPAEEGIKAASAKLSEFRRAIAAARESGDARLAMLQLAEELAEVELARVTEIRSAAKWHVEHAEVLRARRADVLRDVQALATYAAALPQDQTIAAAVRAAALAAHDDPSREPVLRTMLAQLARFTALAGSESLFAAQDDLLAESERQRAAIRLSDIHSRENAVLLRHGLEGLARYYEGGLDPAAIANLLRAAQAIALAVIAGKVD